MHDAIKKVKDAALKAIGKKNEEIKNLKADLERANAEKSVTLSIPNKVEIKNFPETQKVEVTNQKRVQSVHVLNLKDIKMPETKFPDKMDVRVVEMPESEKSSGWLPQILAHALTKTAEYNLKALAAILGQGVTVRLSSEERQKPLPVVMVDINGRPISQNQPSTIIPLAFGGGRSGGGNPLYNTIGTGRQTVSSAGTAVQLVSASTPVQTVTICSLATNSGEIFVGDQNVKATAGQERGSLLEPTGSVTMAINNLNKIWIDAVNSNDGVSFTYLL